jgi:hypothetical protein
MGKASRKFLGAAFLAFAVAGASSGDPEFLFLQRFIPLAHNTKANIGA